MQTSFVKASVAPRPARCVAAKAIDRRHMFAAIAAGLAIAAPRADAVVVPSQESTGGATKKGSMPTSSSEASMSSYGMEGTKKQGISPKRRKELLAEVKAAATAGKYSDQNAIRGWHFVLYDCKGQYFFVVPHLLWPSAGVTGRQGEIYVASTTINRRCFFLVACATLAPPKHDNFSGPWQHARSWLQLPVDAFIRRVSLQCAAQQWSSCSGWMLALRTPVHCTEPRRGSRRNQSEMVTPAQLVAKP
eukprot:TRINITY_DN951_c0_g1_i1.p1 TRINITY_DN951_c0_g1~~TRINITY_DN951_c0_g1_i1.p1  ORF type:complete len:247 (+),score=18.02 TRINITY_DN951_c0_g1_i1:105-845(+)